MHATKVYSLIQLVLSFANAIMFTTYAVYYVNGLHLNPLQLLLVGTVLELTVLFFETPTGIFADTRGRRFSVITGVVIMGVAFILEGLVPFMGSILGGIISVFVGVLIAEIIRGVGETFVSGASTAWITDEIGEKHIGPLFLKVTRWRQIAGFLGIVTSVTLSSIQLFLPYVVGGFLYLLLGFFLLKFMRETNFKKEQRDTNGMTVAFTTFKDGVNVVKRSTVLISLLLAGIFVGAGSEGFDRLWEAHFLTTFSFPTIGSLTPSVWFGIISVIASILCFITAKLVEMYIDTSKQSLVANVLLLFTIIKIIFVILFAFATNFITAFGTYLIISMIATVVNPLYDTWLNQNIPSRSRATVLSMMSQINALGQSIGGPFVGAFGTRYMIRIPIMVAGLLQLPLLWVYYKAKHSQGAKMLKKKIS